MDATDFCLFVNCATKIILIFNNLECLDSDRASTGTWMIGYTLLLGPILFPTKVVAIEKTCMHCMPCTDPLHRIY
jgi:hypothetical protein